MKDIVYPPRDDRDDGPREFPTSGQENEMYRDADAPVAVNRPLREAERRYVLEQARRLREEQEEE